jgi:peroxiredoxin
MKNHIKNLLKNKAISLVLSLMKDKKIRDLYGAKKKFFQNLTTKRGVFLIDTDKTIIYRFWGQQDNQAILDLLGVKNLRP